MTIYPFSDGFIVHIGRVSAWYTHDGLLIDAEAREKRSPKTRRVNPDGPLWERLAAKGPKLAEERA